MQIWLLKEVEDILLHLPIPIQVHRSDICRGWPSSGGGDGGDLLLRLLLLVVAMTFRLEHTKVSFK